MEVDLPSMAPSTTGRDRKAGGRKAAARPAAARGKSAARKAPAATKKKAGAAKKAGKKKAQKKRTTSPDLELDADVLEFIEALDRFKKAHNKPFPSWSEVLHVLRSLGYRKVG